MRKKRFLYLAILSTIVFVYVSLFTLMNQPDVVEAQNCFQVRITSCIGPGCLPPCPGGFLAPDIINSGYTPGLYGIPMSASICMNFSGGTPCNGLGTTCTVPADCCTGVCAGSGISGGPLCCSPGQVSLCVGGSNALGCCSSNADCPGGTCG